MRGKGSTLRNRGGLAPSSMQLRSRCYIDGRVVRESLGVELQLGYVGRWLADELVGDRQNHNRNYAFAPPVAFSR